MPDVAQAEAVRQARRKRVKPPEAKAKSDEAREKLGVVNPFSGRWAGDRWASPEKQRQLPVMKRA